VQKFVNTYAVNKNLFTPHLFTKKDIFMASFTWLFDRFGFSFMKLVEVLFFSPALLVQVQKGKKMANTQASLQKFKKQQSKLLGLCLLEFSIGYFTSQMV
jgi:hypothetical protein